MTALRVIKDDTSIIASNYYVLGGSMEGGRAVGYSVSAKMRDRALNFLPAAEVT
jgi:hypothetical protein